MIETNTILIVEDEGIIAAQLQKTLKQLGYQILGVTARGEEALQIVAQQQPDLVLMDVRLAGRLDGIETAAQIQAQFDIPIVYLTAFADEALLEQARVTGPYGYLVKPIRDRALRATIEMALQQHQLGAKLRESEEKYRLLIENAREAITVIDPQGRIELMNQAAAKYLGGGPRDFIGKTLWDILPEETADEQMASLQQVVESGQGQVLETVVQLQGQPHWFHSSSQPLTDRQGRVISVLSLSTDITKRVQAEKEIRQQTATLTALHETALDLAGQVQLPDILRAIVVRATHLLEAKGGGIYLYRADSDDLELALTHNLVPDVTGMVLQRGEGPAGRVLESGQPLAVQGNPYREGPDPLAETEQSGSAAIVPIQWGQRPLGVLAVSDGPGRSFTAKDVTLLERLTPLAAAALENNRLLSSLQQQMEQLKQTQVQLVQSAKLAAIGELAAGVAHELNNPLTAVLGFTEILREYGGLDATVQGDLETIEAEARRARDIVRSLLEFARQSKPQRQPTNLNAILQQTLAVIRYHLRKRGIRIQEDYAPDLGLVPADEGQMKQVFLNLISNAVQAMPQGGNLTLRTTRVKNEVVASVTDSGLGIPADEMERIFDPFFSTKPGARGLGLSVSLGIVQEHRGRITVESEEGRGSTFSVWLPAKDLPDDQRP